MTTLADLLPALKTLPHSDKLRAVQFLMSEIAKEEEVPLDPGAAYPSWSPYTGSEATDTLLDATLLELSSIDLHTRELTEKQAASTRAQPAALAEDRDSSRMSEYDSHAAEASFRQGWQEAQSGQTYPLAELWDGIHVQ